jgi:hypothetical protein
MANQPFQFGSGTGGGAAGANQQAGQNVQNANNALLAAAKGGNIGAITSNFQGLVSPTGAAAQAMATPTNYGGYAGGANDAANAFNAQGQLSAAVNQPQIAADQAYGQAGLAGLQQTANGQGPAQQAAAAQLAQGVSAAQTAQSAAANSARGGGAALGAAQAEGMANSANIAQNGGMQAAQLRAQMAGQAQQGLVSGAQGAQSVNQQGATGQAGIIQGAEGLGNQAELGQAGTQAGVYGTQQGAQTAANAQSQAGSQFIAKGLMGVGGGLLGADVHLKEPDGPSHWSLREEPNFILARNERTGELRKVMTAPLDRHEHAQAEAPHGAGPLGSVDNRTLTFGDMSLDQAMQQPMQDASASPSTTVPDLASTQAAQGHDAWAAKQPPMQQPASPGGAPAKQSGVGADFGSRLGNALRGGADALSDNPRDRRRLDPKKEQQILGARAAQPLTPPGSRFSPQDVQGKPSLSDVMKNPRDAWMAQGMPPADAQAQATSAAPAAPPPYAGPGFGDAGGATTFQPQAFNPNMAVSLPGPPPAAPAYQPTVPAAQNWWQKQAAINQANGGLFSDARAKQDAYEAGRQSAQQSPPPQYAPEGGPHVRSDERLKEGIGMGDMNEADHFLASLKPYSYKYKDPQMEPTSEPNGGRYLGVMAQNVEQSPFGRQIVKDTPKGKVLEGPALQSAMAAGMGRLHERVAQLEAMRQAQKPDAKETMAQRPMRPEDERAAKQ